MDQPYLLLSLRYAWDGMEQCVHPVLLFGEGDTVLVDCGYPGSLEQLEAELRSRSILPERLTKLVLTHQDDDNAGAHFHPGAGRRIPGCRRCGGCGRRGAGGGEPRVLHGHRGGVKIPGTAKTAWQPPLALLSRRLPGSLTFGKRQEVSW